MNIFKKIIAVMAAATILSSSATVNAFAIGISNQTEISADDIVKSGKAFLARKNTSEAPHVIKVEKKGTVEAVISNFTYPTLAFALVKDDDMIEGEMFQADTVTIDGKSYVKKDFILKQAEWGKVYGVDTGTVSGYWNEDFWIYLYHFDTKDTKKHTIKLTYNNIEKGNYYIRWTYFADETSKTTIKVTYPTSDSSSSAKTTLSATKLSATVKKNKLTLSWNKVSGAEKYQVCCSTDGGKTYKALKELTKTSATITLKKGSSYKFAVRSYKTVNGKKVYSKFSNVKSVKY